MGLCFAAAPISINQSEFVFQAIAKNYNTLNVTALDRLPETHYAH